MNRTKTYFLSDAHLGAPYIKDHKAHEQRLVDFLDSIKSSAKDIYLLGDIFDFWYEYKHVIPKGFVRFQGKIAELADSGIKIHLFGGNHDMWMYTYFQKELGVTLYHAPEVVTIEGKTFFLAHGEDLGISDWKLKLMYKIFHSSFVRWCFSHLIHPDCAINFAKRWSEKSRGKNDKKETTKYLGEEKEYLVKFAKSYQSDTHIDYFIFGHRHIVLDLMLKKDSRIIILGDWINQYSYAVVENGQLLMMNNESKDQ